MPTTFSSFAKEGVLSRSSKLLSSNDLFQELTPINKGWWVGKNSVARIKQALEPKWHTVDIHADQHYRSRQNELHAKARAKFDPSIPNLPNTSIDEPNS